jgi:rhodanese-related sulfurtransferase
MKDSKINILYWIFMVLFVVYFAYLRGWILTNFELVDVKKAQHLLKTDNNITLLDVRTPLEFKREHIPDAILIPLDTLESRLSELDYAKDTKILVYCHSGTRSLKASRILETYGFVPINMSGGLIEWKKEKFKVVK